MHVSVGRDSAGSFSIRGALRSADGDISTSSSKYIVKCCIGNRPWMLVRCALNGREEEQYGFDKQYLEMLGFVVKSADNQLALVDGASYHRQDRSVQVGGTVFVHC